MKPLLELLDLQGVDNILGRQENRGGTRPGAGRPKGVKTVTVSFRIQEAWREDINRVVREELARLKNK